MKPSPLTTTPALGSIRGDELMPAREFCRRLGLGRKAWAALLHRQFPTTTLGKQKLVDGAAAVAYFRKLAEQQQARQERPGD